MKKVFFPHTVLLLCGRVFCSLTFLGIIFFAYPAILFIKDANFLWFFFFLMIASFFVVIFFTIIWNFFWPLSWSKLVVDNKGVQWRCLFRRSVFLSWDECKYVGFETFTEGNVVKIDPYKTGFRYIYFSTTPYPKEFSGKINKLNCKEGFIKFFPVNAKMCSAVLEHRDIPVLKTYVEQYKNIKKRQERLKQKRSEKLKSKF